MNTQDRIDKIKNNYSHLVNKNPHAKIPQFFVLTTGEKVHVDEMARRLFKLLKRLGAVGKNNSITSLELSKMLKLQPEKTTVTSAQLRSIIVHAVANLEYEIGTWRGGVYIIDDAEDSAAAVLNCVRALSIKIENLLDIHDEKEAQAK